MQELLQRWHDILVTVGCSEAASSSETDVKCYAPTMRRQMSGQLGLWIQFNPLHYERKRKSDMDASERLVVRPFCEDGFHFLKIKQLDAETVRTLHVRCATDDGDLAATVPVTVLVNLFPLLRGHCVLVPRIDDKLPQVLSGLETFVLAAQLAAQFADRGALLFNSLSAFASVNHLHFHLAPLCELDGVLPVQRCSGVSLGLAAQFPGDADLSAVDVALLADWPAGGVRIRCAGDADQLLPLARVCHRLVARLQAGQVAHTVVWTDRTAWLFPRPHQSALPPRCFNLAALELAGLVVVDSRDAFEQMTESAVVQILHDARLSDYDDGAWVAACFSAQASCSS